MVIYLLLEASDLLSSSCDPSLLDYSSIFVNWSRFDSVTDLLEPVSDGRTDQCFISKSYDATSHFETCANDVLSLYTRITGTELDMNISADMNDEDS